MKTTEGVPCRAENKVKYFLIPVAILLIGILVGLLNHIWLWATIVAVALWAFLKIWATKFFTNPEDKKGFHGIASVIFWCGIVLGIGGFAAVTAAGIL